MVKRSARVTARKRRKLLSTIRACRYCATTEDLTLEHIIPLSRGGTNKDENLTIACEKCNKNKGALTHEEYLVKLKRQALRSQKVPVVKRKRKKLVNWLLEKGV